MVLENCTEACSEISLLFIRSLPVPTSNGNYILKNTEIPYSPPDDDDEGMGE